MTTNVDDLPLNQVDDGVLSARFETLGREIAGHARVWARRVNDGHSADFHLDQIRRLVVEHDRVDAELLARRSRTFRVPGPDGHDRRLSPAGDERHRAVLCQTCRRVETWAWDATCNACHEAEAVSA